MSYGSLDEVKAGSSQQNDEKKEEEGRNVDAKLQLMISFLEPTVGIQ